MSDRDEKSGVQDRLGVLGQAPLDARSSVAAECRDWKQALALSISHDLRTPLSLILGHTQLLERKLAQGRTDQPLQQHTEAILQAVQRIKTKLDELGASALTEPDPDAGPPVDAVSHHRNAGG